MNKQKKGFVLAEATLAEINKQLKINLFTIVVLIVMLVLNTAQFMKEYSLFIWRAYRCHGVFSIYNGQKSHHAHDEETTAYQVNAAGKLNITVIMKRAAY